MKQRLLLLLFFVSTILSAQKLEKAIEETLYSINYPSSWKVDNTGRNNAEFFLFAAPINENMGSNINLLIQNLDGMNLDLNKFTEISEKQINTNGKIISSELKVIDNQEFQELTFEANMNGKDMKFYQQYFVKNSKAFIITFTALISQYDKLEKEALTIINTFKVK
jgi:hypothetical protein